MIKHGLDGASNEVKKRRMELLQGIFGTMSWTAVENMRSDAIHDGFDQMKSALEPPLIDTNEDVAA